jgi:putative ABC transport system permease protein
MRSFDTLRRDLAYAARLLRLNPAFTLVAIASLALGIGANTAIFQLLDAVQLRTLPVRDPGQLAEIKIAGQSGRRGNFITRHPALTNPLWEQIRNQQQGFSSVSAWADWRFNLARGGETDPVQAMYIGGSFFETLGVRPVLGRLLSAADDHPGCGLPGAVISYAFWQRRFGGRPTALSSKLTLDGNPVEIVGVAPANFFGMEVGRSFDVAIPVCSEPLLAGEDSNLNHRDAWWLGVAGRLKPGWTVQRASAQLAAISPATFEQTLPANYPSGESRNYLKFKLGAFPLAAGVSDLRRNYDASLVILLALAAAVLLIACANLANLLLARATAREKELAVRLALGASRSRLVRQLLAESLLLAAAGTVLGVWLANALSRYMVSVISTQTDPLFVNLDPDWRVLFFMSAVAVLTLVLFGLMPALRATRMAPGAALKTASRGLTATRERFGLRRTLVVAQVSLSLVLLVGALLFSRSLAHLLTLDAGFTQNGILITEVDFERLQVPKSQRLTYQAQLVDRLRAIPGVEAAADARIVPLSGSGWNDFVLTGNSGHEQKTISWFNRVGPGFFHTVQTPILSGRDFDQRDTATSPTVAIVNESFARKVFPGANPIGRQFRVEAGPGEPQPVYQIIALAKDTTYQDIRNELAPIAFLPSAQDDHPGTYQHILVRSSASLTGLVHAIKTSLAQLSPDIDLHFEVLRTQVRDSLLRERLMATLAGFFGLLAALLAITGLYGVMSYMVARRRSEIGIRMALGADRARVLRLILREAGIVLGIGLAAGTVLALAAARTAGSLLYGLKWYDPITMLAAIGVLISAGLAASLLPARRAARLDPITALRDE